MLFHKQKFRRSRWLTNNETGFVGEDGIFLVFFSSNPDEYAWKLQAGVTKFFFM